MADQHAARSDIRDVIDGAFADEDEAVHRVDTWFLRYLRSSFGGIGLSVIGREGGEHPLHLHIRPTNVCVQP